MMQMHLRVVVGFLLLLLYDRDDDYDGDEEEDNDRDDHYAFLVLFILSPINLSSLTSINTHLPSLVLRFHAT